MERAKGKPTRPSELRMSMRGFLGLTVLLAAATARADDVPEADEPHPVFSADDGWVRPTLIAVGGLFAAAAVVGSAVFAWSRATVPAAATHEEDPAADRHGAAAPGRSPW